MPTCDYCGEYYTFGPIKAGSYLFCSGLCRDNGRVLEMLDTVPPAQVMEYVTNAQNAPCPTCGGAGPVAVQSSFRVYSPLLYTSWGQQGRMPILRTEAAIKRLRLFSDRRLAGRALGRLRDAGTGYQEHRRAAGQ